MVEPKVVAAEEPPVLRSPVEARQSLMRPNMFYVLIGGLALSMIAFVAMFNVH